MYELIAAGANTYYVDCPSKMGIYVDSDGGVYLIDTGNDRDAGKKLCRILGERGWTAKAVFNTHSHGDHIGGNRYVQQQFGCPVYAPGIEAAFTAHPVLEPAFLYGGYPCKALRNKFLMAQECRALPLTRDVLPQGMEMLALPGHSFDMAGFRTPDGVWFLADCLASRNTIQKYRIPFLYDAAAYLETLDMVQTLEGSLFVPSHAAADQDIRPLARFNRDSTLDMLAGIEALCRSPLCFDALFKALLDGYGLTLDFNQYVLAGSTVRSCLAYLRDQGRIREDFSGNLLTFQTI